MNKITLNKPAILLLSGGLASTTALWQYRAQIGLAISLDVGNLNAMQTAGYNCRATRIKHESIMWGLEQFNGFMEGILIPLAVNIALQRGLDKVIYAISSEGAKPKFLDAMRSAIKHGTDGKVGLDAPFINLTKRDVVMIGRSCGVDYIRTWDCQGQEDAHCGVCESCKQRREALEGVDNTGYIC